MTENSIRRTGDGPIWILSFFLALAGLAVGCQRGAEYTPFRFDHSDDKQTDVAFDSSSKQPGDSSFHDTDDASDVDAVHESQRSPYICDESGGEVIHPESEEEFQKPPLKPVDAEKTRSEILGDFNGDLLDRTTRLSAPARLRPGDGRPEVLYANPDEDVVLYFATITGVDDIGDTELTLAMTVNYRPVEAEFRHWNGDRTEIVEQQTGSGAVFDLDEDVELVDIEIDGDNLPDGQINDLGLGYYTTGDLEFIPIFKRIRVVQGGYDRPTHPCLEMGTEKEWSEREEELYLAFPHAPTTALLSPPTENWTPGEQPISVEPGESVRLDYSLLVSSTDFHEPTAVVPLVNGRATDWRRLIVRPPTPSGRDIADRGILDIELPEEPGIHEIRLATWVDPFLLPDDDPHENIEPGLNPWLGGSNPVYYEVETE